MSVDASSTAVDKFPSLRLSGASSSSEYRDKANEHAASLTSEEATVTSTDSDEYFNRCGYGHWRPQCLQVVNSPNCLVIFMAMYSLVLGFLVNGVHNVNISSIERRFDLPSTSMGLISGSYDVSAAVLAVVIGYYGSGKRKARMLALAIFVSALGSLIMALPHWTTGTYSLGVAVEKACLTGGNSTSACANESESNLHRYLYIFLLSQLLHGIGGTTLFTVGVSLVDDSVISKKTPLYLGIIYGCNIVGSGLGYIVGGQLLNIYVDFDTIKDIKLTSKDTRWLGAWWLGPVIASGLQILTCIPISLFGSELPGTKEIRKNRVSQAHSSASSTPTPFKDLKIMALTLVVLRNPCFVFVTLAMTTEGMFLSATAAFLPKFIENEYGIPASQAALLAGIAIVPAAAGGLIMGGWIAKKFNLSIKQIIKYLIVVCTLAACSCAVLWIRCKPIQIYGVNLPYSGVREPDNMHIRLAAPCNSGCNCDTNVFEPVCNDKTDLYFSPCYAGCTKQDGAAFSDCSCVVALTHQTNQSERRTWSVSSHDCRKPCDLIWLFAGLLFFAMVVSLMPIAPGDSVQLRCVLEEHKVYAQGIKTLIVRMLGSFVGPILMGKILDLQCKVWREKCGQNLSCWLYDHDKLVISIYLYIVALKLLSVLFCLLALKFYQAPGPKETVLLVKAPVVHAEQEHNIAETNLDTDVTKPIMWTDS